MAKTAIVIRGADKINIKVDNILKSAAPEVVKAVNIGLAAIESSAKNRCPTNKNGHGGTLRGSIQIQPAKYADGAVSGKVFTPVEYAGFVEFGTGRKAIDAGYSYASELPFTLSYKESWPGQEPRPYMWPAVMERKRQVTNWVKDALKRATKGK